MLNALLIVPILTFLIYVHELGHYVTAKRAGMKVEEFGFGLPPRLWGWQRGETLWSINAIPIGGFVRVLGEEGKDYSGRSMQSKTVGQRALFITAGSIMNFITAFVLIGVVLAALGQATPHTYITAVEPETPAAEAGWQPGYRFVAVNGNEVGTTTEIIDATNDAAGKPTDFTFEFNGEIVETTLTPRADPPAGEGATGIQVAQTPIANLEVANVTPESPAADAGLMAGDQVLEINGSRVPDALSYQLGLEAHAGDTITLTVLRDGQQIPIEASIPADIGAEESGTFGASISGHVQFERPPFYEVPLLTAESFVDYLRRMGEGLLMLVRGDIPFGDVAGPIGMGQLTSEIIEESSLPIWVSILNITIVLSLNLAVLNLLPLPALDGGRLLFIIIEVLRRGKRVAPEKEGVVHFVGLVLLLTFMVAVAFMDIDRIVSGQSLLQ